MLQINGFRVDIFIIIYVAVLGSCAKKYPQQTYHSADGSVSDGGYTGITGFWYGELFSPENEKVSSVGFQIYDDAGSLTGYEKIPLGDGGKLSPLRLIAGTIDGGVVRIDLQIPGPNDSRVVRVRFLGILNNNELTGDYTMLPFSHTFPSGERVEVEGLALKCSLKLSH